MNIYMDEADSANYWTLKVKFEKIKKIYDRVLYVPEF